MVEGGEGGGLACRGPGEADKREKQREETKSKVEQGELTLDDSPSRRRSRPTGRHKR